MNLRFSRLLASLYFCVLVFIVFSNLPAHGQVGASGDTTATPVAGGGHAYIQTLNETIDPEYGSLSIRVAAPIAQERGVNLPIYPLLYDTNSQPTPTPSWTSGQASNGAAYVSAVDLVAPLNLGPPNSVSQITTPINTYIAGQPVSCTVYNNYVYTDPDGGRHSLNGLQGTNNQAEQGCQGLGYSPSPQGQTVGDAQYTAIATNQGSFVRVFDLHGDLMATNEDTHPGSGSSLEDTNGNYLRPSGRQYSQSGGVTTIPGLGGTYQFTKSSGYSDASNYVNRGATSTKPINATPLSSNGVDCAKTFSVYTGGFSGSYYLSLPNSQEYTFTIDPTYGLINNIAYPTGASVAYTWGMNAQSQILIGSQPSSVPSEPCSYIYDWPAISKRVVSINGVQTQEQDFAYTTSWNGSSWGAKTTTVTTTDLIAAGKPAYKTVYTYSFPNSSTPTSSSVSTYDTSGNLLTTVATLSNGYNSPSARCTTIYGANGTSVTKGTFYVYATLGEGPPMDVAEYDYGLVSSSSCTQPASSVTPTRETKTVYQTFSSSPMIKDRPQSVKVYGNGTLLSETDYKYDEPTSYDGYSLFPLVQVLGVLGHDEKNYDPSSTVSRGNATTIQKRCFLASGTTCSDSISHTQYDETGQVVTAIDANGNATQYSYVDNYTTDDGTAPSSPTNTYVTKVTRPTTNGVVHVSYYQYEYNGGKLRQQKDENSQITTYCYWTGGCSGTKLDPWLRLTQNISADGGGATYSYTDSSPNATVQSTTVATPDPSIVSLATYDSMGRITSNVITSAGNIETDITYDGFGRVASTSNPYTSTSDPTYGITHYTYDSLGRKTTQKQPDGNTLQWCYSGIASSAQTNCLARAGSQTNTTWTDVSDAAGNHSQSQNDGLGRLIGVLEPNASNVPSIETDYKYDALDNLTQVDQWGGSVNSAGDRQRLFMYDSLARLVAASNPESGVTCYGTASGTPPTFANCTEVYDGNGNLKNKTDARGTTLSYTYDALNRLIAKTGPGVNYSYSFDKDPNSSVSPSYPIGRLTYQSNGVNADRHYSYDSVGRTVLEEGSSPTNAGTTVNAVSATYDLAGNLASLTYPDGRVIAQAFDAANRLSAVTAPGGTSIPYTYLNVNSFAPGGEVLSSEMGNNVYYSTAFDSRLRQTSSAYTLTTQTIIHTNPPSIRFNTQTLWGKQYTWSANSNLLLLADSVQGVARQFTYDNLNRLISAQDIVPNATSGGETSSTNDGSQDNALATPQSIDGSIWGLGNATIVLNNAVAPDGTMTALTMTANAGSTNSTIDAVSPTPTLFDGATATGKVWLKVPSGTLTTSLWVIDTNSGFAGTGLTVNLTTTWQQFTIPNVVLKNGLVTLALQIGSNNTITSGQIVNVWGPELNVSSSSDTNLLPSSQQVGAAGWSVANGTVQSNALTAPDGSKTAATIVPASGSTDTYLADNVANPAQFSSTTVTGSVYLSASSGTPTIDIYVGSAGPSGGITYTTLPVSLSSTWQRFAITQTTQASLSQLFLQIGGGGLLKAGQTINVWGAQMVVGSSDGNYVATTNTTSSSTGATEYLAANGLNESFTYDPFGNLQQSGNLTFEQSYTTANQLAGWNYDAAGNLLSDQFGNSYTYDANGMISSDGSTTYYYDAEGNRVGKSGSTPTDTIYFGGRAVARYSGGVWTDLIYGADGMLAETTGALSAAPTYRMTDHLGTSVGTLSSTGVLSGPTDYAPFGQVFSGGDTDPYKFTGKERDTESGLDNFGARYYGSNMGRFMSPDPVGGALSNPQSLNRYAYVLNNPLRFTDPSGLDPCIQEDGSSGDDGNFTMSFNSHPPACPITVTGSVPEGLGSGGQSNAADVAASLGVGSTGSLDTSSGQDSFDSGSLAAGLFGAQGLPYWGNANVGVQQVTVGATIAYGGAALSPFIAGGVGSAVSWGTNATGLLGPTAGRVFWSAIGAAKAAEWAEEHGGYTLEMSPLGGFANWAQGFLPQNAVTGTAWNALSSAFASGAQGGVTYLQGPWLGNTWLNTELPILIRNGNPIVTVPMP